MEGAGLIVAVRTSRPSSTMTKRSSIVTGPAITNVAPVQSGFTSYVPEPARSRVAPVAAQAFTPPRGVGSITVAGQYVDNTGHRQTDGNFVARGQSVTMSADFEVEYGIASRFSVTLGIPYVFAKYTGAMPPPSRLPVDACGCWHSSFQDLSLAGRYRLGSDTWAVTPVVRYGHPSHDYPYQGEAVVGRKL